MKRLLDESLPPELKDILRSADDDAPRVPEKRQDRIIAAIATASTVGTAATAVAAGSRIDGIIRIAKWGVPLVGVIAAATFGLVSEGPARAPSHAGTATPAPTAAPLEPPPRAETPADPLPVEQGVRVEDLPTATPAAQPPAPRAEGDVVRAPTKAAPVPTVAPEPNIDAEIAAIDKARAALTAGQAAEALTRVETYRSTFAAAHFADEADAIEVQALAALGRKDEARRKAEVFLERRARSPYAQRVRSAVGLK